MHVSEYHLKRKYQTLSIIKEKTGGFSVKSKDGIINYFSTKEECLKWINEYRKKSIELKDALKN